MTKLELFYENPDPTDFHRVLTHWIGAGGHPRASRYDIVPVGVFERIDEGRFFRLARDTQQHRVVDYAEVHMSQGNSFIHNAERIDWIDHHTQGQWHVELGDPREGQSPHLMWSFSNVNDAVLFKLTWHL